MNNNINLDNMSLVELEQLKSEIEGKTLKISNNSKIEKEKAYVEQISESSRINRDNIQAKRNQRYEEMISNSQEIESPMNKNR